MKVSKYHNPEFLAKYRERMKIHKLVPFPAIVKLSQPLRGKRILDIGCGSGELDYDLAKLGAKVTGIDVSPTWITACKEKYTATNLRFFVMDGSNLGAFSSGAFDEVIMNMVLLNVDTKTAVKKIFKEISRVLKPKGILIFSDLHPAMKMSVQDGIRYQKYSKAFSYFKDGSGFTAGIRLSNGSNIEFANRHWTMETLSHFVEEAGMAITRLIEPSYKPSAPKILRGFRSPEYLLFFCKKI